jgi:hypothetical protein
MNEVNTMNTVLNISSNITTQTIKQTPSISSSAMLVELNISLWTGRKFDKTVSQEIDAQKQTTTRAGNYHKNLTADEPHFIALNKFGGNARTYHYHATMPWSDSGVRLLTTSLFFDYQKHISGIEQEFYRLVDVAVNDWDNMLLRAQIKLGDLFNISDYPHRDEIRDKYKFSVRYSPVPEIGDWRVDVGNEALKELAQSYELAYQQNLEQAYKDVWTRTYDALKNMSTKLDGTAKQIFRDTLVGNVREMIELLDKFNITGDAEMKRARDLISDALMGVTPDALREDTYLRQETKAKVDALLKEFSW